MFITVIKIVSAHCGAGKTKWAIQKIKNDPTTKYIFCTPYLSEIQRIMTACGTARFYEPENFGNGKRENYIDLIKSDKCICTTHVTFLNGVSDAIEQLKEKEYTLILDETIDLIQDFNDISAVEDDIKQYMSKGDVEAALADDIISIADNRRVEWNGKYEGGDYKLALVRKLARENRLFCTEDNYLVVTAQAEIFAHFKEVYVLTYMHRAGTFMPFLEMFNYTYEEKGLIQENGEYNLCEYSENGDKAYIKSIRPKITICKDENLNPRGRCLSKTWYERSTVRQRRKLKNNCRSYLGTYIKKKTGQKANSKDVMWTTYKAYEADLEVRGYKCRENDPKQRCFVPCNMRATNDFSDRWILAYLVSLHPKPSVVKFIADMDLEFKIDTKLYSLSFLLQWMFRSRLRKDEQIIIYIPDEKLRNTFEQWLNTGKVE